MPIDTAEIAARFRAMADAIELNKDGPFGGAFVVVPPADGGDVLETLILDNRQDPGQFWLFLKTKSETEVNAVDQKARAGNTMYGRQR